MKIFYIHGFLTSARALKAHLLDKVIKEKYKEHSFLSFNYPDLPKDAHELYGGAIIKT